MINLVEPKRDEPIKADLIRDMIRVIRANSLIAGIGLLKKETDSGTIFSLAPARHGAQSIPAAYPRAFDIKSVVAGTMTLTRCHFQIQSQYFTLDTEPTLTIANGVVCAIVNTATSPVTVTAAMNYVWTAAAPNLMPMALYDITVSSDGQAATVTCDRRGSIILFHE